MRALYFCACFILLAAGVTDCEEEKMFRVDYQYFSEADGWFKLHHMPLSWQEARLRCAYEGAMLASPTTYGMTAVIRSFAAKNNVAVYTGIHATLAPGDFNSLDGIPLEEIPAKWKHGTVSNGKCIVYHGQGVIEDVDCDKSFPFLCYKKHSKDLKMTECGTTDTEYKMDARTNKCYKFHHIGRPYDTAMGICSAEGSHLAIINSESEAEVLKELFEQYPAEKLNVQYNTQVHLGFYNWHTSNFFGTLDGQTLKEAGYDKWKQGEPSLYSGRTRQACGAMFRTGLLDDSSCTSDLAFICEKHPESLRKSTIDIRFSS